MRIKFPVVHLAPPNPRSARAIVDSRPRNPTTIKMPVADDDAAAQPVARSAYRPRSSATMSLGHDRSFTDAEIVTPGKTFSVHRNILGSLSPRFFKFFAGQTGNPRMPIPGASVPAMTLLLDFAYGMEVEHKLEADFNLAMEIIFVANKLDVTPLKLLAADVVMRKMTVCNAVTIFRKLFKHEAPTHTVVKFIADNLDIVADGSPGFKEMQVRHVRQLVGSQELVAPELKKFEIVQA